MIFRMSSPLGEPACVGCKVSIFVFEEGYANSKHQKMKGVAALFLTTIALAMKPKPVRILPLGQTHVVVVVFVVGTASSDSSTISCGSVLPAVPGYSRGHRLEQASLRATGVRIPIIKRRVVRGAGRPRSRLLHLPHILCTTSGALNGFRGIASLSGA